MKTTKNISPTRRFAAIGLLTMGAALALHADPVLPVNNPTFSFAGSAASGYVNTLNPTGWTLSSTATGGQALVYVETSGASATSTGNYQVYSATSAPNGGNFILADGSAAWSGVLSTTITGLTVGQTYTLTFWEATSEQTGFNSPTTENWLVSLGTSALTTAGTNPDGSASTVSGPVVSTPAQGSTPWTAVSVSLTADATTDILSFFAQGTPADEPPSIMLALATPEPASISLALMALVGVGGGLVYRRKQVKN